MKKDIIKMSYIDKLKNRKILKYLPDSTKNYDISKFVDLKSSQKQNNIGGSELFTISNNKSIYQQSSENVMQSNYGTVIRPIFPDTNACWYYSGFPSKLNVGKKEGDLIDYIPICFYATRNGNETFILPKLPDRIGYINTNNEFSESLSWNGSFKSGQLMFTLLLYKNDSCCKGSVVTNNSYWSLMTEFSKVNPNVTASKTITVTSGIPKQEIYNFETSIGSSTLIKSQLKDINEISKILTINLRKTFNVTIEISEQSSTTDTVTFKSRPVQNRIAIFQFYESFRINPAQPLMDKISDLNNKKYNYLAKFSKATFRPLEFQYNTKYFAKAFVLKPS